LHRPIPARVSGRSTLCRLHRTREHLRNRLDAVGQSAANVLIATVEETVNNDDLQLLVDFRSEVPAPDEATAERIYRLATTTRPARRRSFALHLPRRRQLVVAAAAALSLAGALVGLTLSAAAPESAYAAAKKAIAASSAGAVGSGTMTMTRSTAEGSPVTVITVRWNGDDIAIASAEGLPGSDQLLLVAGGVFVQRADGSWLHYASKADLEPPLYAGTVQAARGLAAGSRGAQIIASAYGLQKTVQPDASTVYSGTNPPSNRTEVAPSNDTGTQLMLPGFGSAVPSSWSSAATAWSGK
jgi:hypothetical protein